MIHSSAFGHIHFRCPINPSSAAILTRGRGSACACTADKMAEKKKAVSFTASELSEGKSKKQPPTQKYDRKEIQKRLDIENWMDEELKRIYAVEVNPSRLRAGYLSSSFFDIAQPLSSFNSCSHVLPVSRCSYIYINVAVFTATQVDTRTVQHISEVRQLEWIYLCPRLGAFE